MGKTKINQTIRKVDIQAKYVKIYLLVKEKEEKGQTEMP